MRVVTQKNIQGRWLFSFSIILFALLIFFGCGPKKASLDELTGTWNGYSENGEVVEVTFSSRNNIIFSFDQVEEKGSYTIDLAKKPFYLTFSLDEKMAKKGLILSFISRDMIQVQWQETKDARPISFDDKKSMVLKKKI